MPVPAGETPSVVEGVVTGRVDMILAYTDISEGGKPCRTEARITTQHPMSSCGQPVIVLPDGEVVDTMS